MVLVEEAADDGCGIGDNILILTLTFTTHNE
jgi:hypothetical protein